MTTSWVVPGGTTPTGMRMGGGLLGLDNQGSTENWFIRLVAHAYDGISDHSAREDRDSVRRPCRPATNSLGYGTFRPLPLGPTVLHLHAQQIQRDADRSDSRGLALLPAHRAPTSSLLWTSDLPARSACRSTVTPATLTQREGWLAEPRRAPCAAARSDVSAGPFRAPRERFVRAMALAGSLEAPGPPSGQAF